MVVFFTTCPSRHWSKVIRVFPNKWRRVRRALVAQMELHRQALGVMLLSLGSTGCSKKFHGAGDFGFALLSSSTSCWSDAFRPSTQQWGSLRPRTGGGAHALGIQRRMLQARQLGPPPPPSRWPANARLQRSLYGWSRSRSCSTSLPSRCNSNHASASFPVHWFNARCVGGISGLSGVWYACLSVDCSLIRARRQSTRLNKAISEHGASVDARPSHLPRGCVADPSILHD